MKQKVVNQGLKKNLILYKGRTGWKVKTRIFGSLVVTLSALALAEGTGTMNVHAATDPSTGQVAGAVEGSEKPAPQVALKSSIKPSTSAGTADSSTQELNKNSGSNVENNGQPESNTQPENNAPQKQVAESESLTEDTSATSQKTDSSAAETSDSGSQYPVLSEDGPTNIGVDNTEVNLTADQIADHFTATVVDRDDSDGNVNPAKNTHVQKIGKDGSVSLTSNDYHDVYTQNGTKTSVLGHQVAHVSFEHEIDFTHNFSLSGALGIGSKPSGGADSVGVVFAPGDPAKATEGGSGGELGIGELANAFGFVFDEWNNQNKNDPSTNYQFNPYFGWRTTDSNGKLQRVASSSEWKLASAVTLNDRTTNPLNDFTMDYNAETKTLTVTLGGQTFTRTITDTSQGYSISVAASTGGNQNDYSARIDKFTYTPKTVTLTDKLVDSADSGALLDQASVKAVANIGDTVSVFSTQAAAARAVAAGLVDPNLISILPTDSAGNVYVIDGNQTPSSTGTPQKIDNSGVSDNTYYTYTVQDGDDQTVTIPVRLAFKANVTPVDSVTGQPIAGLDPVTVVAVDGEPTLVQIPGYTPTKVTLAAPKNGDKVAEDTLPIDQGTTKTGISGTTTDDTATPISHYYSGSGKTVDGQTVTTGTVKAGTGQSVSDNLDQQPLVDQNGQAITSGGKTIGSSDYYWSTIGNAGATDSTDEANPQASGSLLLPTTSTLDYWETQATDNQTKADTYKAQAQQMYQTFMGITGLTQAQKDDAQALLNSVSETYTNISEANGTAKADFEAAKTATESTDIYADGQSGYASLEAVQNLLVSFEADLKSLGTENKDAESSLATFKSWEENYGSPIDFSLSGVSFGPDFWTGGTEQSADFFSNPDYYEFYSTDAVDGDPVTPKAAGKYFFKLTDAGREYLKSLNPNNNQIGLYVSSMLTINPVNIAATVEAATVEYGGGHAADGTAGTWPAFTGSLGEADADHTVSSTDFEVVDKDGNVVNIKDLQVNGDYTIRYKQAIQDELAKDKNYTFTSTSFGTAKLTVTPRKITVTAQDHGKTFGTADDPTLDLTSDSADGLVNGDTVASLGVTLHRAAGEDAHTYDITEDPSSKLNSNYDITVKKGTFTIARLAVTVQAKDLSKTYGDEDPQLVLVDGHQLTAGKDFTLSRVAGETVGPYKISGSDVSTSNYNVTVDGGTFTIAKRPITIQINNRSKTYGDTTSTDPASTWQIISQEGLAENDTSDMLNVSLQKQAGEEVGHYAITGTYDNANYAVKFVDGTFLINPRVVAVTIDPQEKTYGEVDPTLTSQLSDGSTLASGQKLSDLVTLTRKPGEDVGTYTINGSSKSNDYTFEITPGKLTINKRAITVQVDNQSKTYDNATSTDPALTWRIVSQEGLAENDTLDMLNVNLQRQAGEDVGHYAITGTFDNPNYDAQFIDGTLLINPRVVAVIIDPQEKT
ncbi:MBG domain-containing protein, partial [Lactobacillus sp. HBUAS51381]|uniref:MBG domain-containing protein n=1 Tax=Lactobacillus sp. HBUAS51381 TaxID=2722743 RepID=UPI00169237BB